MLCPLCRTELPNDAEECTKCDWVREAPTVEQHVTDRRARDWAALWLSLVPGLGHLYKGHVVLGGAIFFVIGPLVLALSLSVLPATLGVSIVIPVFFLAAVMMHAYEIRDKRGDVIRKAKELNRPSTAH